MLEIILRNNVDPAPTIGRREKREKLNNMDLSHSVKRGRASLDITSDVIIKIIAKIICFVSLGTTLQQKIPSIAARPNPLIYLRRCATSLLLLPHPMAPMPDDSVDGRLRVRTH